MSYYPGYNHHISYYVAQYYNGSYDGYSISLFIIGACFFT